MKITPILILSVFAVFLMSFALFFASDKLFAANAALESACKEVGALGIGKNTCEFNMLMTKSFIVIVLIAVPIFIIYIFSIICKVYKNLGV